MSIRSSLFDRLARLLILYEHLRVEAFAAAASAEELKEPAERFRIQDSLRRFIATLFEFERALYKLSQTDEYKSAERKFESDREMKTLIATVSRTSRRFHAHHSKLRGASRIAAAEFAGSAPASTLGPEAIKDAICMIRDGYAHATQAMHALVAAFVWERL
jgi:hypothetical protein